MKNLTTKPNTTSGATTYIQKEFNALTIEGNEVIITVTRKIINIGLEPLVCGYKYDVTYNNKIVNGHNLTTKNDIEYYLNFVDKYAGTRFL